MTDTNKLHVVVSQWFLSDQLISFFEVSKLIASKGHKISFISTPQIIKRLPKLQPNLAPYINFVTFSLPQTYSHNLMKAFDSTTLQSELTQFLENSAPDWIIYDFAPIWLLSVISNLGISRAFFNGTNTSCLASMVSLVIEKTNRDVDDKLIMAINGCDVIVTRDCFESDYNRFEIRGKPVIQLGLMPPSLQQNGDDKTFTWLAISDWLDKKEKGSVIYVSLGSNTIISQNSLTELALGLELSEFLFLWSFKKLPVLNENDQVKLPSGFEQRMKGRGIVCRSWAPELKILAHESVGCFLTQCSWSCIIEGLMFGQPLIMLPFNVEQRLNAKIMVKDNVGMEIVRNEHDESFIKESVVDSLRLVMDRESGDIYRENAKAKSVFFSDKIRNEECADSFVDYLQNTRRIEKR